jgi:AAA+ ATPase superfamily predicted ATPase
MKFYDRERELTRIKKEFTKFKNHSSVLVLAGRRRIGIEVGTVRQNVRIGT